VIIVDVSGRRQLEALARRLDAAADRGIRRELTKAMNTATEPAKDAVRASALSVLPKSGGLAELVAAARISTRTTLRSTGPSVRMIQTSPGHDLKAIDRGRVRHPVFYKKTWVNQEVPPGYWTVPMEKNAVRTRRNIVFGMQRISRMVAGG
jgi:hypothetical protein